MDQVSIQNGLGAFLAVTKRTSRVPSRGLDCRRDLGRNEVADLRDGEFLREDPSSRCDDSGTRCVDIVHTECAFVSAPRFVVEQLSTLLHRRAGGLGRTTYPEFLRCHLSIGTARFASRVHAATVLTVRNESTIDASQHTGRRGASGAPSEYEFLVVGECSPSVEHRVELVGPGWPHGPPRAVRNARVDTRSPLERRVEVQPCAMPRARKTTTTATAIATLTPTTACRLDG